MKKNSKKSKRKSELKTMFFIILVAAVMFIISTYAWFSTQKNVSITNLQGTVEVAEGLEISLDAQTWSNGIVLGDEEGQLDIIEDAYSGNKNIKPSEMLPVSTLGLVSELGSTKDKLKMIRGKVTNTIELSEINEIDESIEDPNNSKFPGYFSFDIFLKNSSKSDDEEDILQLNYDSSLEILVADKKSTGLQNTARVAFAKYKGTSDVMADQATILKETGAGGVGATPAEIIDVSIWEPNSNDHVDYIVQNNNHIIWSASDAKSYATKDLGGGKKGFDLTTQMPTYGLKASAIGQTISNIYKWDGTEQYLQKQNVLQTTKTGDDDYTIKEGVQNLVSTADGTTEFKIAPNKVCRLKVYVWLEGQDVDCINYASHGGGVKLNIGLVKGSVEGTHEVDGD